MKQSIILIICVIFSFEGKAENNFNKALIINDTLPGYNIFPDSNSIKSSILGLNPGNKFLFKSEKGNLFSLAPDNMYCIAPIELQQMPVQKDKVLPFMPNQIPQVKKLPLTGKPF